SKSSLRYLQNMRKIQFLILTLCVLLPTVVAQNKLLTIDDIFSADSARQVRFGGTPVAVQWAGDGKSFRQMVNGRLMRVDALTGQAVPYFDSGLLAAALVRAGVRNEEALRIAN